MPTAPTVTILGKTYPLASLDPMPVDLRLRRRSISQAARQIVEGGPVPAESMMLLMYAALGLLARRWSPVAWRVPVAQYGEAVVLDALERCPEAERDRLQAEIDAAAVIAWRHCWGIEAADKIADDQPTEAGSAAAEGFSDLPRDGSPR